MGLLISCYTRRLLLPAYPETVAKITNCGHIMAIERGGGAAAAAVYYI